MRRTWAWCSTHLRWGSPDLLSRPSSRRRARRSAGRAGSVGALVRLVDERHGLAVEQRPGPSAALESAALVLMLRAVSLHHSVDGDLRGGRQFHDRGSLPWGPPPRRPLTPATNTSALIRHRLPDFSRGSSGTPVVSDPTAQRFRATAPDFLDLVNTLTKCTDEPAMHQPATG